VSFNIFSGKYAEHTGYYQMNLNQMLMEYDQKITIDRMGSKLLLRGRDDDLIAGIINDMESDNDKIITILAGLENLDPTNNKQYMAWIIKNYIRNAFSIKRDRSHSIKVRVPLMKFEQMKNFFRSEGITTDINQYTVETLGELVNQYSDTDIVSNTQKKKALSKKMKLETKIWHEGPLGTLLTPKTQEASCFWGRNTRWCTSATQSNNHFESYNRRGPLYIWLGTNGAKFQFHFDEFEFRDDEDENLPIQEVTSLRTRHPVISQLFQRKEQEILDRVDTDLIEVIRYATRVLQNRWPEAESLMLGSSIRHRADVFDILHYFSKLCTKFPKSDWNGNNIIRWQEAEPMFSKFTKISKEYSIIAFKGIVSNDVDGIIEKNPKIKQFYSEMRKDKLRKDIPVYAIVTEPGLTDLYYEQQLTKEELEYYSKENTYMDGDNEVVAFHYELINPVD